MHMQISSKPEVQAYNDFQTQKVKNEKDEYRRAPINFSPK